MLGKEKGCLKYRSGQELGCHSREEVRLGKGHDVSVQHNLVFSLVRSRDRKVSISDSLAKRMAYVMVWRNASENDEFFFFR